MIIQDSMNPSNSVCEFDKEWIGSFYKQAVKAATAKDIEQVHQSMEWCSSVQAQVIELTNQISTNETIHRDINGMESNTESLEFVESNYSDLIGFIAGVGVAVSEISERLRAAKDDFQKEAYQAELKANERSDNASA